MVRGSGSMALSSSTSGTMASAPMTVAYTWRPARMRSAWRSTNTREQPGLACGGCDRKRSPSGRGSISPTPRWLVRQPGVATVVVGASKTAQVEQNVAAMAGPIGEDVFERMTAISDQVMAHMPDVPSIYYSKRSGRR